MAKPRSTNTARLRNMEQLPSGGSQPSLCVAYLVLTGTSGWALKHTSSANKYALGTFSFLLGHSLIGFLHTTHPKPAEIIKKIFRQTALLAEVIPIALMNADFYLINGYSSKHAYAHVASVLVPLIASIFMEAHTRLIIDVTVLANIVSLLYLYIVKELGVWICGLIVLTALNHYGFKRICSRYEMPKIEIVTIGLSFFTVFTMNCLTELKA